MPLINPDGALFDIKGKTYKYWRKNRKINPGSIFKGVDLNRNYSYKWGTGGSSSKPMSGTYRGTTPFSEPEIVSVKRFIEKHDNVKTMISFHTFSELILYPWGHTENSIKEKDDHKVFELMAKKMSSWNKYEPMQSSSLYVASGDTCDWAYGVHGIFCFTFELSPKKKKGLKILRGFYPGDEIISSVVNANLDPVLYLLENSDDPYKVLKN